MPAPHLVLLDFMDTLRAPCAPSEGQIPTLPTAQEPPEGGDGASTGQKRAVRGTQQKRRQAGLRVEGVVGSPGLV